MIKDITLVFNKKNVSTLMETNVSALTIKAHVVVGGRKSIIGDTSLKVVRLLKRILFILLDISKVYDESYYCYFALT
uniref:Uncharacterized protein n=1 Tax=Salix viminalis TaxID=40686 RepID=A0A6N2KKX5_SALVM